MSKHKDRTGRFIFGDTELKFDFSWPVFWNKPRFQSNKWSFSNLSKECQTKSQASGQGFGFDCICWHCCERSLCVSESSWRQTCIFDFGSVQTWLIKMLILLCLIEQVVSLGWSVDHNYWGSSNYVSWKVDPKQCFWKNIFLMTWSFFVVCHWLCTHCADLHIHILKTIKPINKTHYFFLFLKLGFFWNQKSTVKSLSLFCFAFGFMTIWFPFFFWNLDLFFLIE